MFFQNNQKKLKQKLGENEGLSKKQFLTKSFLFFCCNSEMNIYRDLNIYRYLKCLIVCPIFSKRNDNLFKINIGMHFL